MGTAPCIASPLPVTWIALATAPAQAQQTRDSTAAAMAAMRVDLRTWAVAQPSFSPASGPRRPNRGGGGADCVCLHRVGTAADSQSRGATVSRDGAAPSGTGFGTLPATGPCSHVADRATVTLWAYRDHVPVGSISPTNWSVQLAKEGWLSWSGAYSGGFELSIVPPGVTRGGFGLRSPVPPGIPPAAAEPAARAS